MQIIGNITVICASILAAFLTGLDYELDRHLDLEMQ